MEYAALGMPAIASRTSAIQAYFSDTNAEFFEPGNVDDLARCITNLYHNPEFMTALARGSQNFNQRYNWAKISKDYVSLVDRLEDERFNQRKLTLHPELLSIRAIPLGQLTFEYPN